MLNSYPSHWGSIDLIKKPQSKTNNHIGGESNLVLEMKGQLHGAWTVTEGTGSILRFWQDPQPAVVVTRNTKKVYTIKTIGRSIFIKTSFWYVKIREDEGTDESFMKNSRTGESHIY